MKTQILVSNPTRLTCVFVVIHNLWIVSLKSCVDNNVLAITQKYRWFSNISSKNWNYWFKMIKFSDERPLHNRNNEHSKPEFQILVIIRLSINDITLLTVCMSWLCWLFELSISMLATRKTDVKSSSRWKTDVKF